MNLSAPFLATFFKDQMDSVLPYCDYIIGNEAEALAYQEAHDLKTTDITEIAKHLAVLPKHNTKRPRVVVITQGTHPTIVATSEGGQTPEVQTFPVHVIEEKDIVDTNGAGYGNYSLMVVFLLTNYSDAFAGGFLGGLVKGESLETCVDMGQWLASWGIRELGPAYVPPFFSTISIIGD